MKKTRFHKLFRYHVRRLAYNIKLLRVLKSISREKYDEKVSASLLYGFLSAIAVNFFFQPGHVYSSGATGLAQILSVLSQRFIGFTIPVSLTFYAINIPLMIVAWYQIGHKFTIFTFITVSMSSLFIQLSKSCGESVLLSCERQVVEQKRGGLKQIMLCLFCRCYSSFISKAISKSYIIFISASLIRPFNSISTTICTFP